MVFVLHIFLSSTFTLLMSGISSFFSKRNSECNEQDSKRVHVDDIVDLTNQSESDTAIITSGKLLGYTVNTDFTEEMILQICKENSSIRKLWDSLEEKDVEKFRIVVDIHSCNTFSALENKGYVEKDCLKRNTSAHYARKCL